MHLLQTIHFKHGFYGLLGVGILIFLFGGLFTIGSWYQITGFHLVVGIRDLLRPQPLMILVVFLALSAAILAARERALNRIAALGAASIVLLIVQIGNMSQFSATPAYYLLILLTAASTLLAWSHGQKGKEP